MTLQSPYILVKSAIQTESPRYLYIEGGSNSERFDWKEVWYPILFVKDLDKTLSSRFTLLEKKSVIWWDKTGATWRVFEDYCLHPLTHFLKAELQRRSCWRTLSMAGCFRVKVPI